MAELNPKKLTLTQLHKEQLIAEAEKQAPNEACGVIAGVNGEAKQVFPVTNVSENPLTYLMDPKEQIAAFFEIEELGLELVAFFHSHPHSLPLPSPTDIHESTYPDTPHIIIGKERGEWNLRVFLMEEQGITQLDLEIAPH